MSGHEFFVVGDDIECLGGIDLHLAVLDLNAQRFEQRQNLVGLLGSGVECSCRDDRHDERTECFLTQADGERCLVGRDIELLHLVTQDVLDGDILGELELQLEDPRTVDGQVGDGPQPQLVIAKDELRSVIDDQPRRDRLRENLQSERRAVKLVVERPGPLQFLIDFRFVDPQHARLLFDGQRQIASLLDGDRATFADHVEGMNAIRGGGFRSRNIERFGGR